MDSPAGSQEISGAGSAGLLRGVSGVQAASVGGAADLHHHHQSAAAAAAAAASSPVMVMAEDDSDFETEPDATDWRPTLAPERRDRLSKREAKRQDVINGEES